MKRKYSIGSFLFGLTIFLALLIQSIHSFHHIEEAFSKEHCHHDYSKSKHQITHSHEFDNCFTCQFAFSTSDVIKTPFPLFENNVFYNKFLFYSTSEIVLFFKGSSHSLRGPPYTVII